ncbi:RloB family protein [Candidatus Spongiihabitans sp.]|uniref:RloB family protein n=1 Tax=Candidatus Spongiihabitans sp. TaxID=3101308 RepID=UPI003C7E4169
MGTDNLFHKRKERSVENLARLRNTRESYSRVLIVCEGAETEPNYFNELIRHYKISSANVEITGKCGSSPKNVVDLANSRYNEEKKKGNAFDKVFCVFDKDSHPAYQNTLDRLRNMSRQNTFFAITSIPAFEYWFLLHYAYSTQPYTETGSKSAADNLISDLQKHLPDYAKTSRDMFSTLIDKMETAKTNAARALSAAESADTDNPSTRVHELVEFLQNIKR